MNPIRRNLSPHTQSGFGAGLITALIFLIALATTLMGRQMKNSVDDLQAHTRTQERMTTIENAIAAYASNNAGNLPCPARYDRSDREDEFGKSVEFTAGTPNTSCSGTSSSGVAREDSSAGSSVQLRIGSLPTATLGLPTEMAYDEWGGRFTFAIVEDLGDNFAGFTNTHPNKFIEILDEDGGSLLSDISTSAKTVVGYVLISHGANGYGAYNKAGNQNSGCTTARVHEYENCDFSDDTFVKMPLSAANASDADLFDDIVHYKMYK